MQTKLRPGLWYDTNYKNSHPHLPYFYLRSIDSRIWGSWGRTVEEAMNTKVLDWNPSGFRYLEKTMVSMGLFKEYYKKL